MTRKTVTQLYAQATADFADNAVGAITPAKLRQFCLDFLDTIRPSYAGMTLTGNSGKAATTTPSSFVWTTVIDNSPDYTVSLASGTVTRNNGPATERFTFNIDVIAPVDVITTFTLFVNGVATAWAVSNTASTANDVQSYSMSAIHYSPDALLQYVVQVSTNINAQLTLSNGEFIIENVPLDNP